MVDTTKTEGGRMREGGRSLVKNGLRETQQHRTVHLHRMPIQVMVKLKVAASG